MMWPFLSQPCVPSPKTQRPSGGMRHRSWDAVFRESRAPSPALNNFRRVGTYKACIVKSLGRLRRLLFPKVTVPHPFTATRNP
jgi:hypothetical protein